MKLLITLLIGLSSVAAYAAAPRIAPDEVRRLQLNKAPMELVDVRLPPEFSAGHIQGARNAPDGEIGSALIPDHNARIIVYCVEDPCPKTDRAAAKLQGFGYTHVEIMADGFAMWLKKGYPVVVDKAVEKPRPGRLSTEDVKDRLNRTDLTVLDTGTSAQFAAGHLKGAINLPAENILTASIAKDRDVLVYDRTATRARQAAQTLMEAGYKVYEMPGGMMGWLKKGYPLEVK
jgi:rhodanese-related sulfurtransferase